MAYTDTEAREIARRYGLETGTVSSVAKKMNIEIDNSRKIIPNFDSEHNLEYEDYFFTNWTCELAGIKRSIIYFKINLQSVLNSKFQKPN